MGGNEEEANGGHLEKVLGSVDTPDELMSHDLSGLSIPAFLMENISRKGMVTCLGSLPSVI